MKSLIDRFFANTSRFEIFLLLIPFVLWIVCFRYFFNGQLSLEVDAISYADQIAYYTDNLSKGVYPLWDPAWFDGAPYQFFLRRIGDVNPLLSLIVFLKWFGVPSAVTYLIFVGIYYFLAVWAFYLITRILLLDHFYAFLAYIILLFSSWGSEIFYNYIIIIFVPIIWFFYFLLSFARHQKKSSFLGLCFCVGLILTTYIPFFFLTILTIFLFFYILFYGQACVDFLKHGTAFFLKNKFFTAFCLIFLLVSCVPGLMFYKESKGGQFVLPNRHSGAEAVSSAVAVGVANVTSGDIISHGYFDRIFDDQEHLDMGDIYLPYIFFLILLMTVCARINKLIFFLMFNILALSLITITSAGGMHRFLYDHIIIFKFIRNIYYFFWLAMLPMGILLAVSALKSLMSAINHSSKKLNWAIYIIICHLLFMVFLCTHQGVLWGAWFAVIVSLAYFLIYFRYGTKTAYLAGFCLILLSVFVQSLQVYNSLDRKLFDIPHESVTYKHPPTKDFKRDKLDVYYASNWFTVLVNYIDPWIFDEYRVHKFIFYSNVVPCGDNPEFFKVLQTNWSQNTNIAFLPRAESQESDWRQDPQAKPLADVDPIASGELSLISSDANTLVLKAHLTSSEFLVINDNYNSDWHAYINGRPAHLFRANVSFKGLWVPAGESDILLRFSTPKCYLLHFILIAFFAATFIFFLVLLKRDPLGESTQEEPHV